jgi:hypothetical protein
MRLKTRLAAVEARLRKTKESEFLCVVIEGGLRRNGYEDSASFGEVHLSREANETVDAFHSRVREAARARGERFVVFGGLPPMPTGEGAL